VKWKSASAQGHPTEFTHFQYPAFFVTLYSGLRQMKKKWVGVYFIRLELTNYYGFLK
jgi:hypothetical protein